MAGIALDLGKWDTAQPSSRENFHILMPSQPGVEVARCTKPPHNMKIQSKWEGVIHQDYTINHNQNDTNKTWRAAEVAPIELRFIGRERCFFSV